MKLRPLLLTLVSIASLGVTAQAQQSISITNSGFEDPALNPGDYTGEGHVPTGTSASNPIPGWTLSAATTPAGEQNGLIPQLYSAAGSNLQGSNFAYNDGTSTFYQDLGADSEVQAGTYTLTVALGQRPAAATAGAQFFLEDINGNMLASSGVVDASATGSGKFTDFTISYTAAPNSDEIGQSLVIALAGGNEKVTTGVDNDDFDNVRLTFQAATVPEPSTYAMLLGGVTLLGLFGRRVASQVL